MESARGVVRQALRGTINIVVGDNRGEVICIGAMEICCMGAVSNKEVEDARGVDRALHYASPDCKETRPGPLKLAGGCPSMLVAREPLEHIGRESGLHKVLRGKVMGDRVEGLQEIDGQRHCGAGLKHDVIE